MEAISVEQVRNSLKQCMDPEVPLSIVDMGLIYGIDISVSYTHLRAHETREDLV